MNYLFNLTLCILTASIYSLQAMGEKDELKRKIYQSIAAKLEKMSFLPRNFNKEFHDAFLSGNVEKGGQIITDYFEHHKDKRVIVSRFASTQPQLKLSGTVYSKFPHIHWQRGTRQQLVTDCLQLYEKETNKEALEEFASKAHTDTTRKQHETLLGKRKADDMAAEKPSKKQFEKN